MPHPTGWLDLVHHERGLQARGLHPLDPKTKLSEFYAIPKEGIGVRGGDIARRCALGLGLERQA